MIDIISLLLPKDLSGTAITIIVVVQLLWLWSVVAIARERTDEPTDRVVWLMIVLFLNILGTVLYLCFSPVKQSEIKSPRSFNHTNRDTETR